MSNLFETLGEREILALAIYGEARGESIEGKVAVASVIVNRLRRGGWFGSTLREVILKPWQFSAFLENDPNRRLLEMIARNFSEYLGQYEALRQCWWVAVGFLDGWLSSNVGEATHYFATSMKSPPEWASGMALVARIGKHQFYAEN